MKNINCLMIILIALTISIAQAGTVLIYQEDFTGTENQNLNGRAPTVGPIDVYWLAGGDFRADGSVIWDENPFGDTAYLPFGAEPGYVYELSINFEVGQYDNQWFGMGFTQTQEDVESRFFDDAYATPIYWALSRSANATQNDQTFTGPNTQGGAGVDTISANDIRTVLDTSGNTWVVSWYFDGQHQRTVNVNDAHKDMFNYVAITNNQSSGTIHSFKLERTAISISSQPSRQLLYPGQDAQFSIEVDAQNIAYQWYKSADSVAEPATDMPLPGRTEPVLTIADVQIEDQAYYYCLITDTVMGDSMASRVVPLGIRRMKAHWTLDEDDYDGQFYLDVNTEDPIARDALVEGTPSFTEGMVDQAVSIDIEYAVDANDVTYVNQVSGWADAGIWNPADYTDQLTVSFWLNWQGNNDLWQTFIAKRAAGPWTADLVHWQISCNNVAPTLLLETPQVQISVPDALTDDGRWQHIAATFDGSTGRLYLDGELAAEGDFQFAAGIDAPIYIGYAADGPTSQWPTNGSIDDIRIYNYALSDSQIAAVYYGDSGLKPCIDRPALDYTGDCIVGIQDFAQFAVHWLTSGLYEPAD